MALNEKKRLLVAHKGFTASELLGALTLMSVIGAIAIPRYVALRPQMYLDGAAREVLGKLMWARSNAVKQNNQWVVSFPSNHTIQLLDDTNNNGSADAGESFTTIDINTDYPAVTIGKSGVDPIFSTRGTAGGSTTVTISNASGSRTVTVNASGNVKIN